MKNASDGFPSLMLMYVESKILLLVSWFIWNLGPTSIYARIEVRFPTCYMLVQYCFVSSLIGYGMMRIEAVEVSL